MAYRFLTYVHFEIRHIEFEHKKRLRYAAG